MADYYPLIARAVAGLPQNTSEARRALYDRARNALVARLSEQESSGADLARERRLLEEAIRTVEMEATRQQQAMAQPAVVARRETAPRPHGDGATRKKRRLAMWCIIAAALVVAGAGVAISAHLGGRWLTAVLRSVVPQRPSPLKLSVDDVAVAAKFLAYVGGGANISPPDAIGGGGGIPLISFSNNGPAFMAGEVRSNDDATKLIKTAVMVTNPTQEAHSFAIGDVRLVIGSGGPNDFVAVGYDSKLCAMSDADRKTVSEIVVTVPPAGTRRLTFAFPLLDIDAKRGALVLGGSAPVAFEINGAPGK